MRRTEIPENGGKEIVYKRAKRYQTSTGEWRAWESKCGQYKVAECVSPYHSTHYYAMVWRDDSWHMIEHMKVYRTRKAAEKAITTYLKPKKKRAKNTRRRLR